MKRSKSSESDIFFLISDKLSHDPIQTDAETVLEAVAVSYLQQQKVQQGQNVTPAMYVQILSSVNYVINRVFLFIIF